MTMRMRPGPAVALLLLVGLGAWVYFDELKGRRGAPKDETTKDRAIAFDRKDLKAIRIKNGHGEVRLERNGEAWTITDPLPTGTDKDSVDGLLSSLEFARVERRLGATADLKGYGLEPPKATLSLDLQGAGGSPTLSLGDASPVGGTYFALLPGGKEVAVVSASLGDLASKDLLGLRDKTLLALDPWKVNKLGIERGRETVLLEKPENGWKLQQPVEAPADGPTVTDLLTAVERLRATAFETEKATAKDLRRLALDPPSARMTILQEGWDVEKRILIGRTKDGSLYARTEGRDPILAIPKDFWEKVATKVDDLRRKEIFALGQYRVATLTAARAGRPALVLTRQKEGGWIVSGAATGTVKAETADTLLRDLGALKARSFDDRPSEAVRASLSKRPALELTVQEEAEASGGAARSQHLVFGPSEKEGSVRVRDMAWRPIAVLPAAALGSLDKDLDAVVKEASEAPKATPAPSPAPSPTASR